MTLAHRLAQELIRTQPARAAVALELTGEAEAAKRLAEGPADEVAPVLKRMSPRFAAHVLGALDGKRIEKVVASLPLDVAARLTRRLPEDQCSAVLAGLDARLARALRSLLRFPEGSAGSLMDPDVLALPDSLTAGQALDRIRETAEAARYNVYVVDTEQKLVGVVNLRELLLADPAARLADFMVRDPQRLEARADRAVVVSHPGWRGVHSLPVVDEHGAYLGTIRYRMLRALEEELFSDKAADGDAREALGELFAAGAQGLLNAVSGPASGGDR